MPTRIAVRTQGSDTSSTETQNARMLTSKGGLRDATGYAKPTQNLSTPRLECSTKTVLGRVFVFVRQTDRKAL